MKRRRSLRLARQRSTHQESSPDEYTSKLSNEAQSSTSEDKDLSSENFVTSCLTSRGPNTSIQGSEVLTAKRGRDEEPDLAETLPKKLCSSTKSKPPASILKTNNTPRRSGRRSVVFNQADAPSREKQSSRSPLRSKKCATGDKLSSSLPNRSQETPESRRRRRLHTVDIATPLPDLIVPSTPPFSDQPPKAGLYDDPRTRSPLSQRQEMKRFNGKRNDGLAVVPLPRTKKGKSKLPSPPGKRNEEEPGPPSGAICTTNRAEGNDNEMISPARRFSLLPTERTSLEEFESPSNRKRHKRVSTKKRSLLNHLPSICVTSVRSK